MKEIETVHEEIERQQLLMESYKKYVDEVRHKGTSCDIARAVSGLHDRADELLKFDAIECILDNLGHVDVRFMSSDSVIDDANKTLGCLTTGGSINLKALSLVHVITSQDISRYAVATLGNEMFVVSYSSPDIQVYDARTFALQCHIPVPGLGSYCDSLTACIHNSCLYASDTHNDTIHRVDLSGSKAVTKWSVARDPRGLSVNKAHNVVVTCSDACKLREYTTHGTLLRETSLRQAGLNNIMHTVQLSTGDYVVSHCSTGAVSVVGLDGQIVCSYGQSQTSIVQQMKCHALL